MIANRPPRPYSPPVLSWRINALLSVTGVDARYNYFHSHWRLYKKSKPSGPILAVVVSDIRTYKNFLGGIQLLQELIEERHNDTST